MAALLRHAHDTFSTETGAVAQLLPGERINGDSTAVADIHKAKGPKDWEYFTFPKNVRAHLVPDENGNAELVVVVGGISP